MGINFQSAFRLFMEVLIDKGGYRLVLEGLKNTLTVAILGLIGGIILGTLVAIADIVPKYNRLPRILNAIGKAYVAIFRGTPIVVQLLVFYYVLIPLLGLSKQINGLQVAVLVFMLNSGAYVSEIMRSGFHSVDPGQMEAGRSLGLSFGVTVRKIVLPQAVTNILPTLGNEFIALIKDTSVISFVAATDLYVAFSRIAANNYEYMIPYLAMALVYIILVLIVTALIRIMERRLRHVNH